GGGGHQRGAAAAGSGEADGLDPRVGDELLPHGGPLPEDQGEDARGQVVFGDGGGQRPSDEQAGGRVGVVGLEHHGAARGERRGGVAARHGERQREVRCAEDRDRAERQFALAQVGARERLAVGQRGFDTYAVVVAGAADLGEQPQLVHGPADLAAPPGFGESGLAHGGGDDLLAGLVGAFGRGVQDRGSRLGGDPAVGGERFRGRLGGRGHLVVTEQGEGGAGRGVLGRVDS